MKTDSYSERMAQLTEAGVRVDSPEAMISLGRDVAAGLHAGSVLALQGGLGAGKTHFTKGIAQGLFDDLADGLGGSPEVTSPTFTLVHEYQGGRLPLYHFDFYRMGSDEEVLRIVGTNTLMKMELLSWSGRINSLTSYPPKSPG